MSVEDFNQEKKERVDIRWLVATRLCLLGIVLLWAGLTSIWDKGAIAAFEDKVYTFIAVCFGVTALSAMWLKWKTPSSLFINSQLLIDVFIVTGIIYLTGGPHSPFLFLYLPLVMTAAILLPRNHSLLVCSLCAAAYSLLVAGMLQGYLPVIDGSALSIATGRALTQIVGLLSAMVLVTLGAGFLTERISSTHLEAEESKKELRALNSKQEMLINAIPEGIITTRLDQTIISINGSAATLLRLEEKDPVGKKIAQLIEEISPHSDVSKVLGGGEIEIKGSDPSNKERLRYECLPMLDEHENETGYAFVFHDVTRLRSVEAQLEIQETMARVLAAKAGDRSEPEDYTSMFQEFIGSSPVMKKVYSLIERVSRTDATVLINGESGTGKELTAKAIHNRSNRAQKKFVAVNCGAIPENLIESELFGHKKGAFTGADSDRQGLFMLANGGTIFLDEIGELPLHLQTKLLRVIQERKVRPVGSDKDLDVDARIVAATNKNLKDEIRASRFREDLYYRLNVINIKLPALRERKEDLPALTTGILKKLSVNGKKPVVSPSTMNLLQQYDYPGNVRELENILERALVLSGEIILPEHLPGSVQNHKTSGGNGHKETRIIIDEELNFSSITLPINLDDILGELEKKYLQSALDETNGAKQEAAKLLGMNFRSFRYRLQKFGIGQD